MLFAQVFVVKRVWAIHCRLVAEYSRKLLICRMSMVVVGGDGYIGEPGTCALWDL